MSKKIKDEQKKFLGETLNQYDKALDEAINQLDKKNREQNHKISSLVNSFDNEYLEKDVEGNMTTLENSKDGMVIINEIQGSTEINYCKDGEKELILNGDIDTQGESFVTITESVDGGLVDVSLEGNTEINLSKTKDPVLVTREFDDIDCNSGKLQYTIDDVTTINDEPGKVDIDRIVGDTMVNHAVNGSEELILNANINESGDNNITLNGVTSDGGLVDVALEGNTMVNVCDQKDSVAITKSYTVETGNHVALQGEYDGKCRPVVTGNTLWIDNATEDVLTAFDDTKNLRLQSSFEDKVVTQEMVDAGEEVAENLGKYKVDYVISREDGTVGQTKTFYLNSPLLEGDTIEQSGNNVVHVHRYGKVVSDGSKDENWAINGDGINSHKYFIRTNIPSEKKLNCPRICDKLPSVLFGDLDSGSKYGVAIAYGIRMNIGEVDANNGATVDELRTWLQSNPLTVVYQLKTPTYEVISTNDTILCDSYVNGHLDFDSAVPIKKVDFLYFEEELTYLYTSTQYAVQFVSDAVSKVDITLGGAKLLNQDVVVGTNKYTITTPSELIDNNLVLNGEGFNASNIVVTQATDQDFGYFEGMKSVGECEDLEVVSSNSDGTLFNSQTLTHEPLRAVGNIKDKYVLIDGKWYIERNCGVRTYQEGDIDNYITDMINTVYPLQTPQYEPIDYSPFTVYSDITHISNNSTIPCNMVIKNHGYNMVALKENTQYTLYVNKNTTNALTYRLGDYVEINSLSKFTFTTPETLTDKTLRIDGKGAKVNDLMLIEGTPTNDPIKYFDGLKSSYECERVTDEADENYDKYKVNIKVTGKNLFDKDKAVYGYPVNGSINNNSAYKGFITSNYIDVKNIDTICIGNITSDRNLQTVRIHHLDKNKKLVSTIMTSSNGIPLYHQMPPNTSYIRVSLDFRDTGGVETDITGITYTCQIEQGDIATEYEPYFESKQTVYLNSPLLKGDEIVWKDNKIQHYHKMGSVVFDGSDDESWVLEGVINGRSQYYIEKDDVFKTDDYTKIMKCDKLNVVKQHYGGYGISGYGNPQVYPNQNWIYILTQIEDVIKFKQWLQQNPTTVIYQLAEPYYEEISVYPLKLNAIANSSLSTESTIQVTNISFNVYEETLPYLYSNTKYYITFNADVDRNNIVIDLGGNHVVFDCKVGFNKVEITTPSNTTNLLTFSGTGVNIDHVMVTKQDIDGYFEGMKSVGECEDNTLEIICKNDDNSKSNTQTLQHEPLRSVGDIKDKYVLIDGKWYIERNCGVRTYQEGDIDNYITDMINTVYPLQTPQYEPIDYSPFTVYSDTTHISNNSLIPSNMVIKNHGYNTILKPSTKYTVALNKSNETIGASLGGSSKVEYTNNVFTITTPSTLTDNCLRLYGKGIKSKDVMILEGDKTNYIPGYFEGLESAFEQEYDEEKGKYRVNAKVVGKNLLNVPRILSGTATTYNSLLFEAPLKLKKGTYTISFFNIEEPTNSVNIIKICNHNDAKNITVVQHPTKKSTFILKEDTEIDLVYIPRGAYTFTELQIEQGDEATSYEPYKESDVIFYINEPLRGVENNKDKVFIQDNKVVVQRNCGSYTFDGSDDENIIIGKDMDDTYINTIQFFIKDVISGKAICKCICDKFNYEFVNSDNEHYYTYAVDVIIFIAKSKLQTPDVVGLKQWLQDNPTTVVYQLAEPVYEEADCDLSKLVLENYENSSLIFESNIPVSANIRYSGEVPIVTQAKSLSSQVDNTTLDINENIIPYMCDIDYRIVELQLMNGDTQGEGIELLGIGDIEILSNENVLFNNREDKKYNYSYDMLKRDILSQRYSKEEYQYRLDRYLLANKISDEEYKELEGLLNNGE